MNPPNRRAFDPVYQPCFYLYNISSSMHEVSKIWKRNENFSLSLKFYTVKEGCMFSLNRECAPLGYGSWQCMLDYHTSKSTRIINWRISGKIYIYGPGEHSSLFHHTSKNEPKTRFFLNDVQQSQPKTDCSSSTFNKGEKKNVPQLLSKERIWTVGKHLN